MPLPSRPLPTDEVEVNGEFVRFRSLSRAEALKLQDYRGREDEAEAFILAAALGDVSVDEAMAWRETTTTLESSKLIDAILVFSGLASEAGTPEDPKPATSEHS